MKTKSLLFTMSLASLGLFSFKADESPVKSKPQNQATESKSSKKTINTTIAGIGPDDNLFVQARDSNGNVAFSYIAIYIGSEVGGTPIFSQIADADGRAFFSLPDGLPYTIRVTDNSGQTAYSPVLIAQEHQIKWVTAELAATGPIITVHF